MRVRVKRLLAGQWGVLQPGQEADLPEDVVRQLDALQAVELLEPFPSPEIETATLPQEGVETAVTKRKKKRED